MGKKEITLEELEAFIIDFKNTFSHVDMGVEINFICNDVDIDSAFYEVKSELDAVLGKIKTKEE